MENIIEQLLNEEMFTTEYEKHSSKLSKRKKTPTDKYIASIRKEIAFDIKSGTSVTKARQKANLKYGKDWREHGLTKDYELKKITIF